MNKHKPGMECVGVDVKIESLEKQLSEYEGMDEAFKSQQKRNHELERGMEDLCSTITSLKKQLEIARGYLKRIEAIASKHELDTKEDSVYIYCQEALAAMKDTKQDKNNPPGYDGQSSLYGVR